MARQPLAERMRPTKLSEVLGQAHIIGKGKILTEIVNKKHPISLILWGPAGSGKTSIARIIAQETGSAYKELSAVTAGKADITRIIEDAKVNNRLGQITVLFVDEIHRFNKSQQDAFLPYVEDGTIVLIGATTENPSFEVIGPLLSRSRVIVLEPLDEKSLQSLLRRAARVEGVSNERLPTKIVKYLADISGGDARVALGNLELALELAKGTVTKEDVDAAAQKRLPHYDKNGEQHYNVISAFIKSMRGSDPNAAIYYLARMLRAGEDPKFIARRMVVFASEDVGLAAPAALNLAVSTFLAVERVGLPECEHNLYHCAIVLAKTDKSRQVTEAMLLAKNAAELYPDLAAPFHLRSKATRRMQSKAYQNDHLKRKLENYSDPFLPKEIKDIELL